MVLKLCVKSKEVYDCVLSCKSKTRIISVFLACLHFILYANVMIFYLKNRCVLAFVYKRRTCLLFVLLSPSNHHPLTIDLLTPSMKVSTCQRWRHGHYSVITTSMHRPTELIVRFLCVCFFFVFFFPLCFFCPSSSPSRSICLLHRRLLLFLLPFLFLLFLPSFSPRFVFVLDVLFSCASWSRSWSAHGFIQ